MTYPIATVLLGVVAATAGGPVHPGALVWGSLYGISQAVGVYWFYPATTVILAVIVLRERVTRWQALGMILAAVSVSMIAAS
ncbi:MAG: hypothetical protein JO259_05025 [Mycobacterium sp.]|nr:hypothetical protein [Mycobacterium sp.]